MSNPPLRLPPGTVIPPPYVKVFGPGANCTLDICPVEISVYGYRPSLAANTVFLALYVVSGIVHAWLGRRWRTPFFAAAMVLGALNAIAGYSGRIALYFNPFSFNAFMVQIGEFASRREGGMYAGSGGLEFQGAGDRGTPG